MLDSNPAGGLELPAKPKELPRYLTTDDSIHLLESIEGKYARAGLLHLDTVFELRPARIRAGRPEPD